MELNIHREVAALQRMGAKQLRLRYAEVFGEQTPAHNKTWLVRRIAWRLQALAEGDLSERARRRAEELAHDADLRLNPPRPKADDAPQATAAAAAVAPRGTPGCRPSGRCWPASTGARRCRCGCWPTASRSRAASTPPSAPWPRPSPAATATAIYSSRSPGKGAADDEPREPRRRGRRCRWSRCAIYTRKSTEEGLEQEFNSLDAQRESAEAFVRSQAGEGWTVLPDRYDDGGFTGGNMERPALKRLLADVEAGRVDAIVL